MYLSIYRRLKNIWALGAYTVQGDRMVRDGAPRGAARVLAGGEGGGTEKSQNPQDTIGIYKKAEYLSKRTESNSDLSPTNEGNTHLSSTATHKYYLSEPTDTDNANNANTAKVVDTSSPTDYFVSEYSSSEDLSLLDTPADSAQGADKIGSHTDLELLDKKTS